MDAEKGRNKVLRSMIQELIEKELKEFDKIDFFGLTKIEPTSKYGTYTFIFDKEKIKDFIRQFAQKLLAGRLEKNENLKNWRN